MATNAKTGTKRSAWLLITAIAVFALAAVAMSAGAQIPAPRCASIANRERVERGQSVYHALPGGLEVRLAADVGLPPNAEANTWTVSVGPADDRATDYLGVVSPPWGTAPHRIIGAAYGVSARASAATSPRRFRFVVNAADLATARKNEEDFQFGRSNRVNQTIDRLGKGTLTLQIAGFRTQITPDGRDTNVIEWFIFSATACVPAD